MLSRLENCFWLEGSTTHKIMTTFGFSIPPSCFAVAVLWELHIITLLIYQERRSAAATTTSGLRAGKADNQEAQKSYSPAVKALGFPPSLSSFLLSWQEEQGEKKEEEETRRSRVSFFPPLSFFFKIDESTARRRRSKKRGPVDVTPITQEEGRKNGRQAERKKRKKKRKRGKKWQCLFFPIHLEDSRLACRSWPSLLALMLGKRKEIRSLIGSDLIRVDANFHKARGECQQRQRIFSCTDRKKKRVNVEKLPSILPVR